MEVLRLGSVCGCFVYSCKMPAAVERFKKLRVWSLKIREVAEGVFVISII